MGCVWAAGIVFVILFRRARAGMALVIQQRWGGNIWPRRRAWMESMYRADAVDGCGRMDEGARTVVAVLWQPFDCPNCVFVLLCGVRLMSPP